MKKAVYSVILWGLLAGALFSVLYQNILLFFLTIFFYIDIFGLDGGCIYVFARIFGGSATFEEHVSFLSIWKPPLLIVQILSLTNFVLLQALAVIEAALFYLTFRKVHNLSIPKSFALSVGILLTIYFFFTNSSAVQFYVDLLRHPNKYLLAILPPWIAGL